MLGDELVVERHRKYREGRAKKNRGGGGCDRDVMNALTELD
jgi:hypothetical protein